MFDNARDANQYLAATVCYYDGHPVYIEAVGADFNASAYRLPYTGASKRINFDVRSPQFNCREFKLGYMNSEQTGKAIFVSRRPARGMAQGLSDTNLAFTVDGVIGARGRGAMALNAAIRDQGFADMLLGLYPDRATAEKSFKDRQAVAVSPWLAIKKHGTLTNLRFLEYRGREISYSETFEFDLPEEFQYLREICRPVGCLRNAA